MPRFVTVGKQTRAGRRWFSLFLPLVNFLTYRFDASPSLLKAQPSVSDKKYRAAGGMMRLSPTPLRDQVNLQGPSHLGFLLLTAIYRVRLIWVLYSLLLFIGSVSSGAVLLSVHLQGPCHLNFFCKSPRNVRLYIDSSMKATL